MHYLASDFMPHMRRCRYFAIAAMLVKLTLKGGRIVAKKDLEGDWDDGDFTRRRSPPFIPPLLPLSPLSNAARPEEEGPLDTEREEENCFLESRNSWERSGRERGST